MKLVVIESPYAGRGGNPLTRWINRIGNVRYARKCMRDSLARDEAPIASHLLYTQPGILRDELLDERMLGIDAGLTWGVKADIIAVYVDRGISSGMQSAIDYYANEGIPIIYRHVDLDLLG
jgi:hypothetical protein